MIIILAVYQLSYLICEQKNCLKEKNQTSIIALVIIDFRENIFKIVVSNFNLNRE